MSEVPLGIRLTGTISSLRLEGRQAKGKAVSVGHSFRGFLGVGGRMNRRGGGKSGLVDTSNDTVFRPGTDGSIDGGGGSVDS